MINELTWLARHVHAFEGGKNFITVSGDLYFYRDKPPHEISFSRDEWLARRAELQNKPSWADAPEWARSLAQHSVGRWTWYEEDPATNENGFWVDGGVCQCAGESGEVLGDWRDTLERRPADISEPAVAERLDEATQNVLAAVPALMDEKYRFEDTEDMIERIYWEFDSERAKKTNPERDIFKRFVRSAMVHIGPAEKLIRLLTISPDNFTASELGEIHQLADAEIVKRDAAVCGGEGALNNHWFESGELPPIGEFVDVGGEDLVYGDGELNCEVIAHVEDTAVIRMSYGLGCFQKHVLSPSRTERDKAVKAMMKDAGALQCETTESIMLNLYDAGYRKQVLPAK